MWNGEVNILQISSDFNDFEIGVFEIVSRKRDENVILWGEFGGLGSSILMEILVLFW